MDEPRTEPASILAVVVLYQITPEDSPTLKTLKAAAEQLPDSVRFKTLIYDNTPGTQARSSLSGNSAYIAPGQNSGISEAYNRAIALAVDEKFDWILTLDQDTELPAHFLKKLAEIAQQINQDVQVAAVLPLIMEGQRILSPHWFKFDFFARAFSSESNGIQSESVYAFNSGALLRVSALQRVGGYNPLFWLDYSDAYLFRMLHLAGYKAFVAGEVIVQHHLSILDVKAMPDGRYRNIIDAGSAFCDLFRGRLVGLEFTYRLIRSYLGQLIHQDSGAKKDILKTAIRRRILQPKAERIHDWTQQETIRRAG